MKAKILYYTNMFFVYSFIGFVIETVLKTFFFKDMNNGILYGPWIPVYGFGSIIIIFITRLIFTRVKANRVVKIILNIITIMLLITLLEFLGGILIEKIFHKVFWNYSKHKYNFGHYISLKMTLLWGAMAVIIIYLVEPKLDKIIKKIPNIFTYSVSLVFLIDVVVTTLSKLHVFH